MEWLRSGVVEQGAQAVPFIGGRGGKEGGTASADELAMMAVMEQTTTR
jgi:hypothetical protein